MNNYFDKPLVVRQKYHHDCHRVFNAFANAKALEHWFSPHSDIKSKVVEFDFRIGGRYRIKFTLPDGTETSIKGEYQSIDYPHQLTFTWCWEQPDPHAGVDSHVTIDFIDHSGTTTEVVVSHIRLDGTEMKERHASGWHGTLHRLQTWLDQTKSQTK